MIGKFDHELKKVVWYDKLPVEEKKGEGPAVFGDIDEHVGVGFPGMPMITSRSQRRELLRQNPHLVEAGGDCRPKEDKNG